MWLKLFAIAVTECIATILLSLPHANATAIVAGVKTGVMLHYTFIPYADDGDDDDI
jgi:hypothetical protein